MSPAFKSSLLANLLAFVIVIAFVYLFEGVEGRRFGWLHNG